MDAVRVPIVDKTYGRCPRCMDTITGDHGGLGEQMACPRCRRDDAVTSPMAWSRVPVVPDAPALELRLSFRSVFYLGVQMVAVQLIVCVPLALAIWAWLTSP